MYKIKLIPSIMIIFSLMVGISYANTQLPKHYPSQLETVGKITKVIKETRVIVLDGTAYKLHPVHDIYTNIKGQQATLYNLKPGMTVGLEFTTYQGRKAAHKVWILPKNYPTTKHTH